MNIQPLLDALALQADAAGALAGDLRAQIDGLQTRLREAETHLEHLAITRKTVTGLADRLPAVVPDSARASGPPPHPRRLQPRDRAAAGQRRLRSPRPRTAAEERRRHARQAETPGQNRDPHRGRHRQLRQEATADATSISDLAPTSAGNGHHPTNRPLTNRPCRPTPYRRYLCSVTSGRAPAQPSCRQADRPGRR